MLLLFAQINLTLAAILCHRQHFGSDFLEFGMFFFSSYVGAAGKKESDKWYWNSDAHRTRSRVMRGMSCGINLMIVEKCIRSEQHTGFNSDL